MNKFRLSNAIEVQENWYLKENWFIFWTWFIKYHYVIANIINVGGHGRKAGVGSPKM